jgi:hypothetical protein
MMFEVAHQSQDLEESSDPKRDLCKALAKGGNSVTIAPEDVIEFENKSQLGKPAYAIVLDRQRKHIMVVVRGTQNIKDMITDAAGKATEYEEGMDGNMGMAHTAVLMSARSIFNEVREKVLELAKENSG